MKVNKELMARARFERKLISELTVMEFRSLMQDCFDADRAEVKKRAREEEERLHYARLGIFNKEDYPKTTWGQR